MVFQARLEVLFAFNHWNVEVLDLLEEALVDILRAGFGEIHCRPIAEHMEMSCRDETVSPLLVLSAALATFEHRLA